MERIELEEICKGFKENNNPFNLAIIAKTGYGKTCLLNSILDLIIVEFNFVFLYTSNERSKKQYEKIILPSNIIIKQFNNDKISIINELKSYLNNLTESLNLKLKTLIIVDDLDIELCKKINGLGTIRHDNIKIIFLVQSMKSLSDKINITSWLIEPSIIKSPEIAGTNGIMKSKDIDTILSKVYELLKKKEVFKPFIYLNENKFIYMLDSKESTEKKYLIKKNHISSDIRLIKEMIDEILKKKPDIKPHQN